MYKQGSDDELMSLNEVVLLIILKAIGTYRQRVLALENYIQQNGPLSQQAADAVKELFEGEQEE